MPPWALASAPSQAFLLGEHAVLYRQPALAASVDIRSRARVEVVPEAGVLEVESSAFSKPFHGRFSPSGELSGVGEPALKSIAQGVAEIAASKGLSDVGFRVKIDSDVPVSSGMASSASVSASVVTAMAAALNLKMSEQELLEAVYVFEAIIHGRASKTGPACAVFGGMIWVDWDSNAMRATPLRLKVLPTFVMGLTGAPSRTKEMVSRVAEFAKRRPDIHGRIVNLIGDLARSGREAVSSGDLASLGELMNINHGLLAALGVSTPELDRIIWAARRAGALGAKLSGAGGGGCAVALSEGPASVKSAIESTGFAAILAPLAREGARVEEVVR
ncbi:MAG TPA: mevalonate kinase [Candidatus Korarchaeota archaeon]|nr:mevalonate kinase [Candidatus Korarchaeota archaeon]